MDSDRERQALSFISGLVLGAIIGAGVAMLTTPQTGRRTRRRIRRSARRIQGSTAKGLEDLSSELKDRVDDLVGAARERIG
jgi:gas vesicle protein